MERFSMEGERTESGERLAYAEASVCVWDGFVSVSVFRRISVESFWCSLVGESVLGGSLVGRFPV